MLATLEGHVKVVNTLLQHGACVDLKEKVNLFAECFLLCFI